MTNLQIFFVVLVAIIHLYIVVLEMVLWTKPKGIKTFGLKSKEFAEETKDLAANQGLYNGFLVAGFIWALLNKNPDIAIFFLSCVVIAGIYGAYSTKKPRIFFVQSLPALLGIVAFFI